MVRSNAIDTPINKPISPQLIATDNVLPLLAKYQMLPQFWRQLAIDAAIAEIVCTPTEIEAARQQFCQQNRITLEAGLENWLARHYMTSQHLDEMVTRSLRIEKFKQTTWGHKLSSYFLKRKGQLDSVIYSLLRTDDLGIAQESYFRIQAGEQSFAELARDYSRGAEAHIGGLVGPVELELLTPELAQRLLASQPGQLLPPFRYKEWHVLVRLEQLLPAQLNESMRQRLLDELFNDWLQQQVNRQLAA